MTLLKKKTFVITALVFSTTGLASCGKKSINSPITDKSLTSSTPIVQAPTPSIVPANQLQTPPQQPDVSDKILCPEDPLKADKSEWTPRVIKSSTTNVFYQAQQNHTIFLGVPLSSKQCNYFDEKKNISVTLTTTHNLKSGEDEYAPYDPENWVLDQYPLMGVTWDCGSTENPGTIEACVFKIVK